MAYKISTNKTFLETKADLEVEFRRWEVQEWRVSQAGTSAVVEWIPKEGGQPRKLVSDDQWSARDNLRKLFLIVEERVEYPASTRTAKILADSRAWQDKVQAENPEATVRALPPGFEGAADA